MKYQFKVFRWENGAKTTEYTQNVVAPIFIEDKLDETLDSGEIVLDKMDLATPFLPKTKFRIELWIPNGNEPRKTWDMVVEHDDVESYVGVSDKYCHRVHLIEPSAIAQGMHCDNFSLTYELNDVTLNYKTVVSQGDTVGSVTPPNYTDTPNGHSTAIKLNQPMRVGQVYYTNSFRYFWQNTESIKNILLTQHAGTSHTISFTVPTLRAQISNDQQEWVNSFEVATKTRIIKRHFYNDGTVTEEDMEFAPGVTELKCGADNSLQQTENDVYNVRIGSYWGAVPVDAPLHAWATTVLDFGSINSGLVTSVNNLDTFNDHKSYGDYRSSRFATNDPIYNNSKSVTFETDALTQNEMDAGEYISYEIVTTAAFSLPKLFTITAFVEDRGGRYVNYTNNTRTLEEVSANSVMFTSGAVTIKDMSQWVNKDNLFLAKGVKYSAYSLLRKALLTCDTHLLDTTTESLDDEDADGQSQPSLQHPIVINELWRNRLKTCKVQETIFENKNLWEILLQIGYYLHAIPYLQFATDGTDRFELTFRQLGDKRVKEDRSRKLTVFNSLNLSEYFTQYDSYVTNLFSPQNEVEEWCVAKTSDPSQLINADTAELQLSYGITELVEFEILKKKNGVYEAKNALKYVFEKSVYDILTNNDPSQVRPSKGASLWFSLGDNKIQGLSYVAPSTNNDNLTALKYVVQSLFGGTRLELADLDVNALRFRIKYKTQDSARVTQFRPDIERFMKNSSYEKYPHHEQFFGQQDKIIDSERFSANLWGRLVRVGNGIYQRQEHAELGNEKEAGDLVEINNEPYYVTQVENEFHPKAIFQKVTYSKNFNQISMICTIPSEPRFYEISGQSKIKREIRINDFFTLSTIPNANATPPRYLVSGGTQDWKKTLSDILFKQERVLPNFALTRYLADAKRQHKGVYGQVIPTNQVFPSSDVFWSSENTVEPVGASSYVDCIVPVQTYPLHNGIIFEWDMADNFKVNDCVDAPYNTTTGIKDGRYKSTQSLRYCDIFGRADLMQAKLFHKRLTTDSELEQIPQTPKAFITPETNSVYVEIGGNNKAVALEKDNREILGFNYQINLLHRAASGDDDFITFPNIFGRKDSDLKMLLLSEEVSMFDENPDITSRNATVIAEGITLGNGNENFQIDTSTNANQIIIRFPSESNITWRNGGDISKVKSIIFYQETVENGRASYIAKNVVKLPDEQKLQPWYIYPVYND